MSAPRLTPHDQLLINLCGWLVTCKVKPDPNHAMMLAQLARVIPNTSRDHALIEPLALAAAEFARTGDALSLLALNGALQPVFMTRATAAAASIWPDENLAPQPASEPAHANPA